MATKSTPDCVDLKLSNYSAASDQHFVADSSKALLPGSQVKRDLMQGLRVLHCHGIRKDPRSRRICSVFQAIPLCSRKVSLSHL